VPVPTTLPDWIVRADEAAPAETTEDFQTVRDTDRAAVLVAYTLLGAAVNGFLPYLDRAGGIRSSRATRVALVSGVAGARR
jgi:hypothetical protein